MAYPRVEQSVDELGLGAAVAGGAPLVGAHGVAVVAAGAPRGQFGFGGFAGHALQFQDLVHGVTLLEDLRRRVLELGGRWRRQVSVSLSTLILLTTSCLAVLGVGPCREFYAWPCECRGTRFIRGWESTAKVGYGTN